MKLQEIGWLVVIFYTLYYEDCILFQLYKAVLLLFFFSYVSLRSREKSNHRLVSHQLNS